MLSKYNIENANKFCNEDISLIENYNIAKESPDKFDCHHRLEIQDDKLVSRNELIELELYYNRPANELIFLSHSEHARLHSENRPDYVLYSISKSNKGKHHSEETKKKLSKLLKGDNNGMFGKNPWNKNKKNVYSKDVIDRLSLSMSGENNPFYGTHYYNNGLVEVRCTECPDGFTKGRLKSNLINLKQIGGMINENDS